MKKSKLKKFLIDSWKDEQEAIMLYGLMASREKDPKRSAIYQKLTEIEKGHAQMLETELVKLDVDINKLKFKKSLKARALSFFGKILGHNSLLENLARGEDKSLTEYSTYASESDDDDLKKTLKTISMEEKSHFKVLSEIKGEGWHSGGGSIRDAIFGLNDGLLSTFSLVAGVSGAAVGNTIVLLAGIAGAIAGAISMAAGAFVSTRAEKEAMEKHIQMETYEIRLSPETEAEELALMYELKGIDPSQAKEMATQILSDEKSAIDTMSREELGINPDELGSPTKAGLTSGFFFTWGALIPITPWIIFPGILAFYVSIIMSLSGFFFIGVGRTLVTGKSPLRSGLEMFLIGTGAAIVTYIIGSLVGVAV